MDFNALSCLMQALMQKQDTQQKEQKSEKAYDNKHQKGYSFAEQNGLGDQVKIQFADTNESKSQGTLFELLSGFSDKNPMLGVLGAMSSGDMSAALPLVMSLMQKQAAPPKEQSDNSNQNNADKPVEKGLNNMSENYKQKDEQKEKTQGALFSPIAFAGYEIISGVCALLKAKRHPCR